MDASHPLKGNSTHQGVEVVCTRNADFSWGTFSASFTGRDTAPVTMQLSEPEGNTARPNPQVKRLAPRLDLIMPRFFTTTFTKPSMPPETSIRWITAPMIRQEAIIRVLPVVMESAMA